MLKSLILAIARNKDNKCLDLRYAKSFPCPGAIENHQKRQFLSKREGIFPNLKVIVNEILLRFDIQMTFF